MSSFSWDQACPLKDRRIIVYSSLGWEGPSKVICFLVIIAQKFGLAVTKYGILGLEGQGGLADYWGENPSQLASCLNSSGEANGNYAQWLWQSCLLNGCLEPVFESTPPCRGQWRGAVGHQG